MNIPLNNLHVLDNRLMVAYRNRSILKDEVTIAVYDTDQEINSKNKRFYSTRSYMKTE